MPITQSDVNASSAVKNANINPEIHEIPQPSYLYSLEPIGVGTPMVEGLQSYIVRLAHAHGVTPQTLLQRGVFPWLFPGKETAYVWRYTRSITFRAFPFNGISPAVPSIVDVLEALTLQSDLCLLTMIPWREGIYPLGMMRKKKVWCSECYREWLTRKEKLYEPLLWSIAQVEVCPVHSSYLESCCRTCGEEQSILLGATPSGYCSSCKSMLSDEPNVVPKSKELLTEDTWAAEQVAMLLAASPSILPNRVFAPIEDLYQTLIRGQKYGERRRTANKLGLYRGGSPRFSRGEAKPSLVQLLKLCKSSTLSLVEFLTGRSDFSSLDVSTLLDLSPTIATRAAPLSIKEVTEYLQNALARDDDAHIGIAEHAGRIGCSREVLHRRFPGLCKAITKRSREYHAIAREKMLNSLVEQARAATLQIYASGEYPSARRVSQRLHRAGCMRIPGVQAMWRETLDQLKLR